MKLVLLFIGLALCTASPSFRKAQTDYVQLGTTEINTATVQQVLNYGTSQIYTIGSQAGKIPVSNFTITNVVSVWKQVVSAGTNYKCQVVMGNSNNVTVNANFTALYKTATKQTSLSQYQYAVLNLPSNTTNSTNNTTNSTGTNNTNSTNTSNTTQPSTNTTNSTSKYTALSQAQIAKSAEVQGALKYGANQTLQNGYSKGKIPVSSYSISKVVSVGKQALSKTRNAYQCSIELLGVNGVTVKAQFVVYVEVSTQKKSVNSFSYQVLNLGSAKKTL